VVGPTSGVEDAVAWLLQTKIGSLSMEQVTTTGLNSAKSIVQVGVDQK